MTKSEKFIKISYLHQIYGSLVTERQRDVLNRYYNCDCSLAEIAEETGVSRQAVRDCIVHAEEVLLNAEKAIGLFELKQRLSQCLDNLQCTNEKDIAIVKQMKDLLS